MECKEKELFPCVIDSKGVSYPFDLKDIETVYSHIVDDESRVIFENRLMYSLTLDKEYVERIIRKQKPAQQFLKELDGRLYIYGAGVRCRCLLDAYPDKKWVGIVDIKKTGDIDGIPIISPKELKLKADERVVISLKYGFQGVEYLLMDMGVKKEQIIMAHKVFSDINKEIYFDERCLCGIKNCKGIFVDAGSYDGNDSLNAMKYFDNNKLNTYVFEPNPESFESCRKALNKYENIKLFSKGISSGKGERRFVMDGVASSIDENGDVEILTCTLDETIGNDKVGFIKMDIEGEEENALVGGASIIERDKPVLALSVYHKRSDIWRLPQRILSINPDYYFCFGHYTFTWGDTVLYAIDKEDLHR